VRIPRRSASPVVRSLAALALATLAACDAGTPLPLAPQSVSAAHVSGGGAAAPVERPWSGRCEFAAQRLSPTSIRITGTCHLTHLGRTTYVNLQTLVPGPVTTFTNATTYTAANGDLLYTTATGTVTPADGGSRLIIAATETPVGGTGRFERAGGAAALAGAVFPASGTGFYELTGTLSYAASDRAR